MFTFSGGKIKISKIRRKRIEKLLWKISMFAAGMHIPALVSHGTRSVKIYTSKNRTAPDHTGPHRTKAEQISKKTRTRPHQDQNIGPTDTESDRHVHGNVWKWKILEQPKVKTISKSPILDLNGVMVMLVTWWY